LTLSTFLFDTKDSLIKNPIGLHMIKTILIVTTILFSTNLLAAPVNINSADAKTIADSLNGIGIKKAQAIVDYRTKNGDFKSIDDLLQVTGIGAKTIEKNKADVLISEPAPADPSKQSATDNPKKTDATEPAAVKVNKK
jgi:competence protein ComEA